MESMRGTRNCRPHGLRCGLAPAARDPPSNLASFDSKASNRMKHSHISYIQRDRIYIRPANYRFCFAAAPRRTFSNCIPAIKTARPIDHPSQCCNRDCIRRCLSQGCEAWADRARRGGKRSLSLPKRLGESAGQRRENGPIAENGGKMGAFRPKPGLGGRKALSARPALTLF